MRAARIPADEQFKLIMECRASGLTDHEWRMQKGIHPGTFYNWVNICWGNRHVRRYISCG